MRVTSAIWVAALIRRATLEGAFVTVTRKGAEEAGAIYLLLNRQNGRFDVYGPSPQSVYSDDDADRRFENLLEDVDLVEAEERLSKEAAFDPDIWTVEIEDRAGRNFWNPA